MYELSEKVMEDTHLHQAAKLVYAVIAYSSKKNPASNLAYASIAQKTSLTEMTVMRSVKQLVEQGWIVVTKNDRGWNCYEVKAHEN